jgi:1,4-dihydroxy-2-naphthoate octaprenyltransferase
MTLRDLSPHFIMIIDSATLPVDFLIMILILKYPFNIWKAIVVTIATATIVITSVLMNSYFDKHRNSSFVNYFFFPF